MTAVEPLPRHHPDVVAFDPLRDSRHPNARSAREQADWLAWLELGGLRPATLFTYQWSTDRLLHAYPDKTLAEITASDIAHILRAFPPASRRTRKAAYDSLFKWAVRTRRLTLNPMDELPTIARTPQQIIEIFTDAEIAALTSLPDNDGTLFLILFDTGLRRGEARLLQTRDCLLEEGHLAVREGKGGKGRLVPLTQRLTQRLADWMLLEALRPTDYLWPTRPGGYHLQRRKPMGNTSFIHWYADCIERADVKYRKPHTTRHTYATRWLRKGGRLETLSKAMGHASIRTTADLYAHLDLTDITRDLRLVELGAK